MSTSITYLPGTIFLPFQEVNADLKINTRTQFSKRSSFSEILLQELRERFGASTQNLIEYGELLYLPDFTFSSEEKRIPYFARCIFYKPFKLTFDSINEASCALKEIQRNWAPYQFKCFRRAALIQEKLPYINLKAKKFPFVIPDSPMGIYTLIDEHTLLASSLTQTSLPAGKIELIEDHENPPSRAYLKLEEALVMANYFFKISLPSQESFCFDAGACPGGWTWVLTNLGSKVFAVDRAPLAEELMKNPLVKFLKHDAFTLLPDDSQKFDYLFSDVICYPQKLYEWIQTWIKSGNVHNFICTIKMQGSIDWKTAELFESIPNSKVVHLNYNKHELTWIHAE